MTTLITLLAGAALVLTIIRISQNFVGFRAQRPLDYADTGPQFDITRELNGPILCEGLIYGPFGKVNARFVADMQAEWTGNKGHISEVFNYDMGGQLRREWNLSVNNDGTFDATAPDIVGTGKGIQRGSGVKLEYTLELPKESGGHVLNVTDWMYLMENGTIINRSQMRKFGFKVGELVATMRKAA